MESRSDFLHRRAEEEDAAADSASCEKARLAHQELATRYRDAVGTQQPRVELELVATTVPRDFLIIE